MNLQFKQELFEQMPVIGIMRNISMDDVNCIVPYYIKAGFTCLEITMNTPNACQIINQLSTAYPNMNIGAGTVCNMDDLKKALDANAAFIVTPIINERIIDYCRTHKIPIFPGAFTPSEIYKAYTLGATAVKVFPATQLGVTYIKDVLAPLNKVKLLPTGGVTLDNIQKFFEVGAFGVGMGGSLFNKEMIARKDYDGLYEHFGKIVNKVNYFK